ncbi:MAG: CrcB family protein [Deltaproteobacteria bacterium]|nr:CrcB family protein [Deltaproteobacteria bacterium]
MLKNGVLVLLGGGIGAALRELLMLSVANLPGGFPMPIFFANLVAALLVGIFAALAGTGGLLGSGGKLLLVTGIMGGLSTFSSFVWGTDQMLVNPAERASAICYLTLSMGAGFLLVELGLWLGARLVRSRVETADVIERS